MDLQGKIISFGEVVTGTKKDGGQWSKQFVVIETAEQYSKKVCVEFFGEKLVNVLQNFRIGQSVQVGINIESTEGKNGGTWYTSIKGWKIN